MTSEHFRRYKSELGDSGIRGDDTGPGELEHPVLHLSVDMLSLHRYDVSTWRKEIKSSGNVPYNCLEWQSRDEIDRISTL